MINIKLSVLNYIYMKYCTKLCCDHLAVLKHIHVQTELPVIMKANNLYEFVNILSTVFKMLIR